MAASRDDFVIAIRSAFLKKGNKQRFSLIGLIFLLNSCGGGGGGSSPVEVTETTQAGFSYSSFSAWISAFSVIVIFGKK